MALNDLSARAVVLIIDHLEAVAPFGRTAPAEEVDRTAAALVRVAKLFNIPFVVSTAGDAPQLTPAVRRAVGDAQVHIRHTTDSFDDDGIRAAIESTGRRTVLIAGIVTEIAAERAAFGGKARGFDTQVVFDACNGASKRSEEAAKHRMSDAGIVLTSVPSVIGELAIDFEGARTDKLWELLAQAEKPVMAGARP